MNASELAIDLAHVAKTYGGRVHALQGVAMQVRRGEIFGLLGPNGAGKSTLVKILMTVVRPSRAEGYILGAPIGDKATLARVGYLPENHRFPRYLTGRQTLTFFGALAKLDRPLRHRRAAKLLDTVGMAAWADRKVGTYSKGMMQRIGIAQALMNSPELVLLDEPTDGVDPIGRRDIREVLTRMKQEGRTVFVNSHLLSELEAISDRVAILVQGRIVKQGTLDELTITKQRYEIDVAPAPPLEPIALPALARAAFPAIAWQTREDGVLRGQIPDGPWIELEYSTFRLGTIDPITLQPILDALRVAGLIIRRVQQVRPSLEDLFLETIGGPNASHAAGAALEVAGVRG